VTPAEFVERAMAAPGIQWRRWRSGWDFSDCFGLLILWHREVLGVEIERPAGFDVSEGFANSAGWRELPGPEAGATCFMTWRHGAPTHCGLLLDPLTVLHAEGHEDHGGSVRITRLSVMRRAYGEMRFYRYDPC
jgi:hypothetical protein